MNKPAILILKFPYSSTYGGGEKHTITLVECLQDRYDFYLVSTCSVLQEEFAKRGWHARRLWAGTEPVTPLALVWFCVTWPFIWAQLIRTAFWYRVRYKVRTIYCLSLTEKVLLTPWAWLFGMRVLWVEHLQIERWLLASPLRVLYVLWSRFATVVTVVQAVRNQLVALHVPEKRIRVIYNSVDIRAFPAKPSTNQEVYEEYRVLFMGRLAKEKGIDDLIHAVATVRKQIPHIKLTIAGQGYWQKELEQLVQELEIEQAVTFVGFVDDVPKQIQQMDAVVLPSTRRETFGIIAAEALATELPVVVTTAGGVSEVVGDCGWVVPPHQPQAIANALVEIYKNYDVARAKAQRGRERIVNLFNEENMIASYDALFAEKGS